MDEDEKMEEDSKDSEFKKPAKVKTKRTVYLPGLPMKKGEKLVFDPSAYHMLHEAQTGAPCLSFDIITDKLGDNRTLYPHTAYIVAGTQADRPNKNNVIVIKASNLHEMKEESDSEGGSESSDSESGGPSKTPKMNRMLIRHHGCVNRIRTAKVGDRTLAGVWSEMGKVTLLDLNPQLAELDGPSLSKKSNPEPIRPLFVFNGHLGEGFGIDWCPTEPGVLATGDCRKNIHVWRPQEGGWHVDQRPLVGHKASVEDLQWSPNERHILASCSVDKSLRIWDTRQAGASACKLTVQDAHSSDINVISWNKMEPLIASGGDDGYLYIWDLRNFKSGEAVATLKHHTSYVTTVEWSPHDHSVFASGGADDQIAIWDLAVERDDSEELSSELKDLPPQLLFIHQGQEDIKELHWHKQIPGMIVSTANSGFNFFRTISV
ncbi:hypothetical protein AAG570_013420 [Ranatra chinensis]|uniref:Glutamate-rich WD repeat-containing protein 1 n=1 Tax=Ranatra chinensis TaxID=642074 RepID=A0ABD0YCE3_9HEMI